MAAVQIEEAELLNHRGNTAALAAMLANKDARKLVLQAQKIVKPDAVIPEIDARAPVDEAVAALTKRLDEEKAEREKEKRERDEKERLDSFKNSWERQKQIVRDRFPDINDQVIEAIEAAKTEMPSLEIAIGPEGGWASAEEALFDANGWRAASLGPRIVRAETAAIAALAVVGSCME